MSSILLKLRTSKGMVSLSIPLTATLSDFKKLISSKTSISEGTLIIKCGYPPKDIADEPDSSQIQTFGITTGDLIIIEENPNPKKTSSKKPENLKNNKENVIDFSKIPADQTPNKSGLIMIRHIIPADNSCLFNAISYNLNSNTAFHPEESRQIVAGFILSDPTYYTPLLEKPPDIYADWILKESSWGGEIEMTILSKHFGIQIVAIDIKTLQCFYYNEAKKRMYVLYDGIHYDSLVRRVCEEIKEGEETLFDIADIYALNGALVVANDLRKRKQYTDLAGFGIQCQICFEGLKGEKETVEHSKKTGHFNFREVNKND